MFSITQGPDNITGTTENDNILSLGGNDRINGGYGYDYILGGTGNDEIYGNQDDDYLGGGDGNDIIDGGFGYDLVRGGPGKDTLKGGPDGDRFDYGLTSDSPVGSSSRDLIQDFVRGSDIIVVSGIDARTGTSGDQAFTFIGKAAFTGTGQLRAFQSGTHTIVQGSNDGDKTPEFDIDLKGNFTLALSDFAL